MGNQENNERGHGKEEKEIKDRLMAEKDSSKIMKTIENVTEKASENITDDIQRLLACIRHYFNCPGCCCIIGQQTNVVVSNETKQRCTYVHLKNLFLVDVVTLLYMDEVRYWMESSLVYIHSQ